MLGGESRTCSFVLCKNTRLRRTSFPAKKAGDKVKVKVFQLRETCIYILLKNKYIESAGNKNKINNLVCTLKKNKRNKFWNNGLHKPFGCSTKKFTMEQIGMCSISARLAV